MSLVANVSLVANMILDAHTFLRGGLLSVAWLVAAAWLWRVAELVRNVHRIPYLTDSNWDTLPRHAASLTVVVPARNEEKDLAATLDALMLADYSALRVMVIDDRSTDRTGTIVDAYVAEYAASVPGRLSGIHVTDLPEGWLGKTFAMEVATASTDSEWLLFTDADILFSPSVLRRVMVFAETAEADHIVVMPTPQAKTWGEGAMLGFMQVLGMWAVRLWRVGDPRTQDTIGIGAFNLVRRSALEEIGGWQPQRMTIVEDVTLGRRMKVAGMRQRVAFAPGLVLLHWASGWRGIVGVMTKNLFSAFGFRLWMLAGAIGWIVVFWLLPVAGLAWWPTVLPSLLMLGSLAASYRVLGEHSQIDARYGWLYPVGAVGFAWALLRSGAVVWWRRGVVWRGTHYPLEELRRHNDPFAWGREAAERRWEEKRARRVR